MVDADAKHNPQVDPNWDVRRYPFRCDLQDDAEKPEDDTYASNIAKDVSGNGQ